jgi:hypothetical protein
VPSSVRKAWLVLCPHRLAGLVKLRVWRALALRHRR